MTAKLIPTMRDRNRYLVFKIESPEKFEKDSIVRAVLTASQRLLGELGSAATGLWLIEWDKGENIGMIRANHKSVDAVRASILSIKEVDKKQVLPYVVGVSGTIKKAKQKWMQ